MKTNLAWALALAAVAATGCVSKGRYDQAVAETETTRAELGRRNASLEQAKAALDRQRADLAAQHAGLTRQTEEITALEKKLAALMKSTSAEGATRESQIADLNRRLDELRAAHVAAEAKAAMFRDLAKRLAKEIDAGDLQVVLRDQRMVLQLSDDVLFDPGKTELKPAGKAALKAVADALKAYPQRQFQVAGHTDDQPIRVSPFDSNWELSSARALRVVHFLLDNGVSPGALSAAGYGEFDPVSTNQTPDGRKHNRRTEITIQPNIDELVHVP